MKIISINFSEGGGGGGGYVLENLFRSGAKTNLNKKFGIIQIRNLVNSGWMYK